MSHEHASLAKAKPPQHKRAKAAAPAPKTSSPRPEINPTYFEARLELVTYFRRESDLAHFAGGCARDGLSAFAIRSSKSFNEQGMSALSLFLDVLKAVNGAGVLGEIVGDLITGARIARFRRLATALQKAKRGAEWMHELGEAAEKVAKVGETVEPFHAVHERKDARTEEQERGEFQVEKLASIRDLTAETLAANWRNEDYVEGLLVQLKYVDAKVDLLAELDNILQPLPEPGELAEAGHKVAIEFELRLYEEFYLRSGAARFVTEHQDGATRTSWEGIPMAVVRRFHELGELDRLLRGVKKEERTRLGAGNRV